MRLRNHSTVMQKSFYLKYSNSIRLGFALIMVSFALFLFINRWFLNKDVVKVPGTASLIVETSEKNRVFEGEVIEGMTVLDALIAASEAGNIKFEYGFGDSGRVDVTELDGYDNDLSKELKFYLNDSHISEEEIATVFIRPGDRIKVGFQ